MTSAWIASNAFALVLIPICWKWSKVGRAIFGLGFAAAAVFNILTALNNPQSYVQGFGPEALLPFYQDFIYGPFARNPEAFLLPVALGQLLAGLLMFFRRPWFRLGLAGAGVFLLAITPLGRGSALPMPFVLLASLWVLWHRS